MTAAGETPEPDDVDDAIDDLDVPEADEAEGVVGGYKQAIDPAFIRR